MVAVKLVRFGVEQTVPARPFPTANAPGGLDSDLTCRSGHPAIASAEPGECWLYCFPDEALAEY